MDGGVIAGKLYTVGGADVAGAVVPTVEAYNPSTNGWATRAPMPTARFDLDVTPMGGLLYAVGGVDASDATLATVEAYTP